MVVAMNSASNTRRITAGRSELEVTTEVRARKLHRWLCYRTGIEWRRSCGWPEVTHR